MPAGLTFADAVGCTEGAFYAVNFLNKVDLPGPEGARDRRHGAIGSAAIQLLAARGIEVDAVCPAGHADLVRSLGAAAVFDADRRDHLVPSEPYDFVFDAVGKSRFSLCRPILTSRGSTSVRTRAAWRELGTALGHRRRQGTASRLPIPRDPAGSLRIVRDLVARGAFRAVIDRTYAPMTSLRRSSTWRAARRSAPWCLTPGPEGAVRSEPSDEAFDSAATYPAQFRGIVGAAATALGRRTPTRMDTMDLARTFADGEDPTGVRPDPQGSPPSGSGTIPGSARIGAGGAGGKPRGLPWLRCRCWR